MRVEMICGVPQDPWTDPVEHRILDLKTRFVDWVLDTLLRRHVVNPLLRDL